MREFFEKVIAIPLTKGEYDLIDDDAAKLGCSIGEAARTRLLVCLSASQRSCTLNDDHKRSK